MFYWHVGMILAAKNLVKYLLYQHVIGMKKAEIYIFCPRRLPFTSPKVQVYDVRSTGLKVTLTLTTRTLTLVYMYASDH